MLVTESQSEAVKQAHNDDEQVILTMLNIS